MLRYISSQLKWKILAFHTVSEPPVSRIKLMDRQMDLGTTLKLYYSWVTAHLIKPCSISSTPTLFHTLCSLYFYVLLFLLSVPHLCCHGGCHSGVDQSGSGNGLVSAAALRCHPFTPDPNKWCYSVSRHFGPLCFLREERVGDRPHFNLPFCIWDIQYNKDFLCCLALPQLSHYCNHTRKRQIKPLRSWLRGLLCIHCKFSSGHGQHLQFGDAH